jgi:channel protein (hemolysin III family)
MPVYPIPGFSHPVSSLSHLLGAGVFALLGFFLLRRGKGNTAYMISLSVFVFSCVFLLSMSGVYHLLEPGGAGNQVLQRLDHAAIFALIAGSFTPVHVILFRGFWRWGVLLLIWASAATGITLKVIFFDEIPEWMSLALYLGMGWMGLASGISLGRRHGFAFIKSLVFSGLSYTLGGLLEFLRWPVIVTGVLGPHELFHFAVLAGIAFHWRFLFQALTQIEPSRARIAGRSPPDCKDKANAAKRLDWS